MCLAIYLSVCFWGVRHSTLHVCVGVCTPACSVFDLLVLNMTEGAFRNAAPSLLTSVGSGVLESRSCDKGAAEASQNPTRSYSDKPCFHQPPVPVSVKCLEARRKRGSKRSHKSHKKETRPYYLLWIPIIMVPYRSLLR